LSYTSLFAKKVNKIVEKKSKNLTKESKKSLKSLNSTTLLRENSSINNQKQNSNQLNLSNTYSNQNINSLKNKNEYIQTKQSKIKNDLNMTAKSEYPVNKNNTY